MARILIVDDDELVRSMITDVLHGEGHRCTSAENVAEACCLLNLEEFQLAISDFHMPSQTGLDLLKFVSSNSPSTSFILISGSADSMIRQEALELGAVACIAKPFNVHELINKVESALRKTAYLH